MSREVQKKIKFQEIFVKRYYRLTDEVNQLIKTAMIEKNLSRAKIASAVGISESYTDHLIRNDRNFREDELQKILPFLNINFSSKNFIPVDTIHGKFVVFPRESSAKVMQIIGYLLGDGTVQPRTIRFKDVDKDVLKVYQKLIEKVFNVKGRIAPRKGTIAHLLEVNSAFLSQWLKENIVLRKKEFLREIRELPKKEIAAFLRGIFDAEGSVNLTSRQVSLRLTDENIVKTSQFLLSRLDIATSFYKIKRKQKNWHDCYGLCFSNRISFKQFIDIVSFSSKKKAEKLKFLIQGRAKRKTN